ncbi:MAG: hypothetical protein WAU88_01560, partial [Candidatus Zixiibacteriota bacterium]
MKVIGNGTSVEIAHARRMIARAFLLSLLVTLSGAQVWAEKSDSFGLDVAISVTQPERGASPDLMTAAAKCLPPLRDNCLKLLSSRLESDLRFRRIPANVKTSLIGVTQDSTSDYQLRGVLSFQEYGLLNIALALDNRAGRTIERQAWDVALLNTTTLSNDPSSHAAAEMVASNITERAAQWLEQNLFRVRVQIGKFQSAAASTSGTQPLADGIRQMLKTELSTSAALV